MGNYVVTASVQYRMDLLAELVANGALVAEAGLQLGLTKGQTANAWRNIKNGLGAQAV